MWAPRRAMSWCRSTTTSDFRERDSLVDRAGPPQLAARAILFGGRGAHGVHHVTVLAPRHGRRGGTRERRDSLYAEGGAAGGGARGFSRASRSTSLSDPAR